MLLYILAAVLMVVGLVGAVVPLIPGPPLIWLGGLLGAWAEGFTRVGWLTLLLMGLLAIPAMASDLIATTVVGRKAGIGWRTIGAAVLGGLIGGAALSFIPVLGTLIGAIAGSLAGVVLLEYADTRDWGQAWQSAKVYAVGFLIGRAFEVVLCLLMIAVFVWGWYR